MCEREDSQDNTDDDDEVFDYLSPTGLRQKATTQDHSSMSSDDSTLSCYSDLRMYASSQVVPIEDSVSCNVGDLFAPESPVINVSLSRRESHETIHVLDIEENKGYDTHALFEDDSSTITVSLSSSSSLNQPSWAVSPTKIEREVACEASGVHTVAKSLPGVSTSKPALDFVELFTSIYCKGQSVDKSLSSSIHAPGRPDHVSRKQHPNRCQQGANRVHFS